MKSEIKNHLSTSYDHDNRSIVITFCPVETELLPLGLRVGSIHVDATADEIEKYVDIIAEYLSDSIEYLWSEYVWSNTDD